MTTAVADERVNYWALWFGLLGAPVAWSLSELIGYAVVAHSCFPRGEPLTTPSVGATWVTALIAEIILLLIALSALWVAWRQWRLYEPGKRVGWRVEIVKSHDARAYRYLAFSGILLGTIFSALVLFSVIALFVVPTCSY